MQPGELVELARGARSHAYAPYSKFAVGAALLTADGTVVTGCNVENASFGLTCCAERVALFHAVSQGHREFSAIAVVTETGASACGACRQVLREFAPDLVLYLARSDGTYRQRSLDELLPDSFGPEKLPGGPGDACA